LDLQFANQLLEHNGLASFWHTLHSLTALIDSDSYYILHHEPVMPLRQTALQPTFAGTWTTSNIVRYRIWIQMNREENDIAPMYDMGSVRFPSSSTLARTDRRSTDRGRGCFQLHVMTRLWSIEMTLIELSFFKTTQSPTKPAMNTEPLRRLPHRPGLPSPSRRLVQRNINHICRARQYREKSTRPERQLDLHAGITINGAFKPTK
jgi:hypothetical protein